MTTFRISDWRLADFKRELGNDFPNVQSEFRECGSRWTELDVGEGHPYFSVRNGLLCNKSGKLLLRTIGVHAFYNCEQLSDLRLPNGLRKIGIGAFKYCSALKSLYVPRSVEEIGSEAFLDCTNLTIRTPAGSYAEEFARSNGIAVEVI